MRHFSIPSERYILLSLLIITGLFSCKNRDNVYTFHAGENRTAMRAIRLDSSLSYGVKITKNTLNDTSMLGVYRVAPGETRRMFIRDCAEMIGTKMIDTVFMRFNTYKATKGVLEVEVNP